MKLNEFRKLLKPMIKEMIREALVEEGLLSNIVSEVAQGLVLAESKASSAQRQTAQPSMQNEAVEAARRDLQAMKSENRHLFEGTEPPPSGNGKGPLSGVSPNDPGINIDNLLGKVEHKWSKLI